MAELTAEQQAFVDWQLAQVDPLTNRRIGDIVADKGLVGGANPQLFNLPVGVTTPGG